MVCDASCTWGHVMTEVCCIRVYTIVVGWMSERYSHKRLKWAYNVRMNVSVYVHMYIKDNMYISVYVYMLWGRV